MTVLSIVRNAIHTVKRDRSLWFFGFFVASAGGTGVRVSDSRGGGPLPSWLVPALVVAGLLALAALVMHVVSESALIDGVRRTRRGESASVSAGLRTGFGLFGRMLSLKLATLGVFVATSAAIALPVAAVLLAGGPAWAGALGSVVLALALLPWLVSVYLVYEYAMRVLVVENLGLRAAVREGFRFLHGRLALSLGLVVVAGLGQVVAGAVGLLFALPAAAIGALVYLFAGLPAALIAGGALLVPVALCIAGALGTYRSSIWTHAYLEERGLAA